MNYPDLASRIRAYVGKCPPAISGQNGHNRTFSVACTLVNGFALSDSEALSFLSEWNTGCQPAWTERDLLHKIKSAQAVTHSKPRGHMLINGERTTLSVSNSVVPKPVPKWPAFNLSMLGLLSKTGHGMSDLWERSPLPLTDQPDPDRYLDLLFPGNPLLCLGISAYQFRTRPREDWRVKSRHNQFIVPSPMSKLTGLTKKNEVSEHCEDNTGPRRFIIVEFDLKEFDDQRQPTVFSPLIRDLRRRNIALADLQAACLLHLSKYAPLVMAVNSGGKSVHGWFFCAGQPESKVTRFFRYAVSLGADWRLSLISQFTRVPDGTRDNGNIQSVYYFNPKAIA